MGSASDPLVDRMDWLMEEIFSHGNWAPGSGFLNNSEFSLTWRLARNALPLFGLNYKAGLEDLPDCPCCGCGLEETAEHALTTASECTSFGIMSERGQTASNPSSSCCSTLVTW